MNVIAIIKMLFVFANFVSLGLLLVRIAWETNEKYAQSVYVIGSTAWVNRHGFVLQLCLSWLVLNIQTVTSVCSD